MCHFEGGECPCRKDGLPLETDRVLARSKEGRFVSLEQEGADRGVTVQDTCINSVVCPTGVGIRGESSPSQSVLRTTQGSYRKESGIEHSLGLGVAGCGCPLC